MGATHLGDYLGTWGYKCPHRTRPAAAQVEADHKPHCAVRSASDFIADGGCSCDRGAD